MVTCQKRPPQPRAGLHIFASARALAMALGLPPPRTRTTPHALLSEHSAGRCRLVCSEARLAAGTKVLVARGGEGVGTPFGWRADSQRKTPLPGGPQKGKKKGKAEAKQSRSRRNTPKKAMGEAGGREQKEEAVASGERRRLGSVCCCVVAKRDATNRQPPFPLSLSADTYIYILHIPQSALKRGSRLRLRCL